MSDPQRPYHVLFLCTGNSARSLLAEMALIRWGGDRFVSLSAGSQPKPAPHPMALQLLEGLGYDVSGLRSKSWDEFAKPKGPDLDFVFTVCDNAAGESCPVWPGQPISAHWGVADPAAFEGPEEEQYRVFRRAYLELEARIKQFTSLPIATLEPKALREQLAAIGEHSGETPGTSGAFAARV